MKEYLSEIKNSMLFNGIKDEEIIQLISCLNMYKKEYIKNEYLYRVNDVMEDIGLLVSGNIFISREDFWGNDSIIAHVGKGQIFGESFVSTKQALTVNIKANTDSIVLFFNIGHMLKFCENSCIFHSRLITNLVNIIANKNLLLNQKLNCLSQRTLREKIMYYLSELSQINDSAQIYIPFNRQELADYLSVDRSALSGELSKMKNDGIIKYKKNYFELL